MGCRMGNANLQKSLGFFDILLFGIGGIVGAGIYAIVGEAAGLAGNMLWASFTLAAFVALLTGMAYAEFVSQFPDAGGSFEFIKQGFGPKIALWMSLIMLLTNVVAPAAIAISFSGYLGRLIDFPQWISTLGIIILMAGINIVGIQHTSWFNNFATIITLLGLGCIVVLAIPEWGTADLLEMPKQGFTGIFAGSALIFFSYVGFEDLVKLAEETKQPQKNMPLGIIFSGILVWIVYVLIAVSAVSVLDPNELSKSSGPLAQIMDTMTENKYWVTGLIIVALFATSKTIMSNIMGCGRLMFDVARDSDIGWVKKLSNVHSKTGTPVFAIIASSLLVMGFSLVGSLKVVASLSNIFVFLLFLGINFALIQFRRTHAEGRNAPFRIPLNVRNIPIPTILAILGLLILLGFNLYNIF